MKIKIKTWIKKLPRSYFIGFKILEQEIRSAHNGPLIVEKFKYRDSIDTLTIKVYKINCPAADREYDTIRFYLRGSDYFRDNVEFGIYSSDSLDKVKFTQKCIIKTLEKYVMGTGA